MSARSLRRYRRVGHRRPPSQSWRTLLKNLAPHTWAADFLTVPTLTFRMLYVFFYITHARRRLVHLNVTVHPTARWVGGSSSRPRPGASSPGISCATATGATGVTSSRGPPGSASRRC